MAKQADDMVLRLLQQIQSTLAEHGKMHEEHRKSFARIEHRLDEVHDSTITALGLAGHANVRHDAVQNEIEALKVRIERLEEKL